ncbi:MAG: GyrI-like domain-containing protein [Provencibacterium sp.]|nr:GyrI-like domain-containing protein [Provencibacterium sp.]
MKAERFCKASFAVIGKQGSTDDGDGFIARLWADANGHFDEVAHLAKRDEQGALAGIWGAMSDASLSFLPWEEDFSRGLYLAGVECTEDAQPPKGWTKWVIPGYEYLVLENEGEESFSQGLRYLQENGLSLMGAVHDFTCPKTGKGHLFFPVRRL